MLCAVLGVEPRQEARSGRSQSVVLGRSVCSPMEHARVSVRPLKTSSSEEQLQDSSDAGWQQANDRGGGGASTRSNQHSSRARRRHPRGSRGASDSLKPTRHRSPRHGAVARAAKRILFCSRRL